MDELNLKLMLQNELKSNMRVSDFNDIARESEIYDENISRSEMTNLLLKKYNLFEIRDIIYDKYMEKKSYSKERLELEEKIKELDMDSSILFEVNLSRIKRKISAFEEEQKNKKSSKNRFKSNAKKSSKSKKTPHLSVYRTPGNICYIYDYIPDYKVNWYLRKTDAYLGEDVEDGLKLSKKIHSYKNGIDEEIKFFTEDFKKAVAQISNKCLKNLENIVLVSAPSSDGYGQTTASINFIEESYKNGEFESKFSCEKNIYNGSKLLYRHTPVEKSHINNNRDKDLHLQTISFNKENLPKDIEIENTGFIILDDISTLGQTMLACKEILIKNDIEKKHIKCLVIAQTIDFRELKKLGSSELILRKDRYLCCR